MKGYNLWSYAPYKPLLYDDADIYICRVVPYEDKIHFEWLKANENTYSIFYRERNKGEFVHFKDTNETECDILNLKKDTDYEFYVTAGDKKSRIRLARCNKSVGVVVNYLHPEDEAYGFSGHYLCSPSLLKHPDGYLLASMDVFAFEHPQNLTLIFRSFDMGKTWHYVSELMPCLWGKMFLHKGDIYMIGCSTEYGDLLISKSTDGAKTFGAPVVLLRGTNGKDGKCGCHTNPQDVVYFNGRIYRSFEWGNWACNEFHHAAMVMSCDENDDLLVPENWTFSYPKTFNPKDAPEISDMKEYTMAIEGTLCISPDNKLLNIMRFDKQGHALVYEVDTQNLDAPLKYSYCMPFNANNSKFTIKYDEISKKYYTIANYIFDYEKVRARNYQVLMKSDDLKSWEIAKELIDYRDDDHEKIGFQYVSFEFVGDDIIYLSRTAINNANSFHNTNYQTFHKIENFRKY